MAPRQPHLRGAGNPECGLKDFHRVSREEDIPSPVGLEKRTSVANAVKRIDLYGTAEAVPFV